MSRPPFSPRHARGGFVPAALAAAELGLPPEVGRRIAARAAWVACVGSHLARRFPLIEVTGRALVVAVRDEGDRELLAELEPALIDRLRAWGTFTAIREIRPHPAAQAGRG